MDSTWCCRGGSGSDKSSPRHKGPRGATWLPSRYRLQRVHLQRQAGLRWADEFDFSFYNRTRFAGLENGVANCYVNSLVQVSLLCLSVLLLTYLLKDYAVLQGRVSEEGGGLEEG